MREPVMVVIFSALAIDATKGLSLGVMRRVRELVWASVGLLILWRHQLGRRSAQPASATGAPLSTD